MNLRWRAERPQPFGAKRSFGLQGYDVEAPHIDALGFWPVEAAKELRRFHIDSGAVNFGRATHRPIMTAMNDHEDSLVRSEGSAGLPSEGGQQIEPFSSPRLSFWNIASRSAAKGRRLLGSRE